MQDKQLGNRTVYLNMRTCLEFFRELDTQIISNISIKTFLADLSCSNVASSNLCAFHFNYYDFDATGFHILFQKVHNKR